MIANDMVPETVAQAQALLTEKYGRSVTEEETRTILVRMGMTILPGGELLPFPAGERCWLHLPSAPVCVS